MSSYVFGSFFIRNRRCFGEKKVKGKINFKKGRLTLQNFSVAVVKKYNVLYNKQNRSIRIKGKNMAIEAKQPNKDAVYILEKSPYGNGEQIVLYVTDEFRRGYICFDDTNRGHMIKGNIIDIGIDFFSFLDEDEMEWRFKEVSIESFKSGLYSLVSEGNKISQLCNTTKELWEYFRIQFPM